ncbi:MAG: flagellar basal body rod protein FlgB [Candidatus Zixiibacteriota bacterium]
MPNKLTQFMFDRIGVPMFSRYLDLASFRHKLVSGNIANAATSGYQSRYIDFQAEFKKMTGKSNHVAGTVTHPHHIPLGGHKDAPPKVNKTKVAGDDINSVDIDREVAKMAQNELLFTIGARLLQRKFAGLKNVITSK